MKATAEGRFQDDSHLRLGSTLLARSHPLSRLVRPFEVGPGAELGRRGSRRREQALEKPAKAGAPVQEAKGDLTTGVQVLRDHLAELIDKGLNSEERLLALARYGFATDNNTLFIYMVGVLSGREAVSNLSTRAAKVAGRAACDAVFADLALPPLGSPQEGYVEVTRRLVEGLRARLPVDTCRDVLAGNNHGIPRRTFSRLPRIYRKSGLDAVLRFRQESLVETLEEHARSGKPWYEQEITPAVVDHVRRNPEIQSGVRVGQSIFVSKIPYAPVAYLGETDHRPCRRSGATAVEATRSSRST